MRSFATVIAATAACSAALAQVTAGLFVPTNLEDFESFPGNRNTISAIFGVTVPITEVNTSLLSVDQGDWSDFRTQSAPAIIPTSGSRFGTINATGGTIEFSFFQLPQSGVFGFSVNASACGTAPATDTIEFFDAASNPIGVFTDPDGVGPTDGTLEALSFVSPVPISRVRWTGDETAIDDLAILVRPLPLDLGRIASSLAPTLIETQGTNFDTEIAIWDAAGTLIESNDDTFNLRSRLIQNLAPGTYTIAVSSFDTSFANGFSAARAFNAHFVGPYTMTINGRRVSGHLGPDFADFYIFEVGQSVDPLNLTGPAPQAQLGILGQAPFDLSFDFSPSTGAYFATLYDAETAIALSVRSQLGTFHGLGDGSYVLAIQEGFTPPSDGYQPGAPSTPATLAGTIDNIPFGPRSTGTNELVFATFTIGAPPFDPADIDMNGTVDVFDLIAFLQAFSAALNP